jgi:predicted dehydrogenase
MESRMMVESKPINVLIIGAGVYVCGRGTDGCGTVLPAVYQAAKEGRVGRLGIAATSAGSIGTLQLKQREIEARMGVRLPAATWPKDGQNEKAYLDALATGQFDCAIIVAPDDRHHALASATLDVGLHTMLVKPFVTKLADGVDLVRKARQSNRYAAVEFHKRYDTANLLMKSRIADGAIGKPLCFHIEYSQRKVVPLEHFATWSDRTTIFQYLGVHYVDMVHFLTGALPLRVMAIGQKSFLVDQGIDTYDAMQVMVEWRGDDDHVFVSNHLTHWVDSNRTSTMSDQKIQVIGTEGRMDSDQKHRGLQIVNDEQGIEQINPYFCQFLPTADGTEDFVGYGVSSVTTFLEDVAKIESGTLAPADLEGMRATFASSLVSQAVLEAADQSLGAKGGWIDVDTSWADSH